MNAELILAFVEIVDAGNLAEAGRRRGVTRSQVSRQLRQLEQQAGAQLLRRTTRQLALTESGHLLYQHGLRILQEVNSARLEIDSLGKTVRGHVRISLPTEIGDTFITPLLLQFAQKHPGITLRVFFANRVVDLIAAEIDIALRVTSSPSLNDIAREICPITWHLYASPDYIARNPVLSTPSDLAKCQFLCPPYGSTFTLTLANELRSEEVEIVPYMQSEHVRYLLDATCADLGISVLPSYVGWESLQQGKLITVLNGWTPVNLGNSLYIITKQNRHPSVATRALIAYLKESIIKLEKELH